MADSSAIVVIYEIGILIVAASLGSEIFKRIRLPGLIGPVLVGLIAGGPGGLGLVTNLTIIETLGVLGSVLILFIVGLEFEASAFWKAGKAAFLLTTGGVVASLCVGYLTGLLLGWSHAEAFLLGVVMAPSGTSVVASVLASEGKADSGEGRTLLTAVVIDDVEGVLLLSVGLAIVSNEALSAGRITWMIILAMFFVLGSIYLGGRLFPAIVSKVAMLLSDEAAFTVFLGTGLVFAFIATKVGLAAITGAFLVGAIVPYTKVGEKLVHRLFFMKETFAAVFFASIGLMIDPRSIIEYLPFAVLVCGTGITARIVGGLVGGRTAGLGGSELRAAIVGLAIRAEMSLIIAREGVASGVIGSDFLPVAATAVILSMLLMSPLYSRLIRKV